MENWFVTGQRSTRPNQLDQDGLAVKLSAHLLVIQLGIYLNHLGPANDQLETWRVGECTIIGNDIDLYPNVHTLIRGAVDTHWLVKGL